MCVRREEKRDGKKKTLVHECNGMGGIKIAFKRSKRRFEEAHDFNSHAS